MGEERGAGGERGEGEERAIKMGPEAIKCDLKLLLLVYEDLRY